MPPYGRDRALSWRGGTTHAARQDVSQFPLSDRSAMTSSDQARTLLLRHVDSFDKLQALLLLANAPGREWTAGELGQHLALDHELVIDALKALCQSGLVRAHASDLAGVGSRVSVH